jgi:alkanesulfonate monooxygenase SsuD/methylene tetrahydromethanopterin reductase-like flavin-dependent oxidoreductase (luciferase family)
MALIGLFTEGALAPGHELSDCYRELGAQIVLADQLGYDFFSTTQSYGFDHPGSSFSAVANPLALFTAHAPLTRHVSILTGIVIAPFHHPAMALSV